MERREYVQTSRSLDGRMEKRIPIIIIVRLSQRNMDTSEEERTYTDNVSSHGARVFSQNSWKPGELARVTSVRDEATILGEVIYCQRHESGLFCIGLKFLEPAVQWSALSRYDGI